MRLSILIATYLREAQPYLDACLKSVEAQTFRDFETVLVSSGDYLPKANVDKHHHSPTRLHFPPAIHKAFDLASKESELILLLNDDVIMHQTCLQELVNGIDLMGNVILNPMSNCDNGRLYKTRFFCHRDHGFPQEISNQQYRIDTIEPIVDDIIYRTFTSRPIYFPIQWNAFYCTMFRRTTWDVVGGIDHEFRTGQDDLDFCMRAHQKGIQSGIYTSAFAFHFSGVSADLSLTTEDRQFGIDRFHQKWGLNQNT